MLLREPNNLKDLEEQCPKLFHTTDNILLLEKIGKEIFLTFFSFFSGSTLMRSIIPFNRFKFKYKRTCTNTGYIIKICNTLILIRSPYSGNIIVSWCIIYNKPVYPCDRLTGLNLNIKGRAQTQVTSLRFVIL